MYLLMFLAEHTKVPQAILCSVITITEGVVVSLLKLEQHQKGYSGSAEQWTIDPGDLWQFCLEREYLLSADWTTNVFGLPCLRASE